MSDVNLTREGAVAVVALDRPAKRNATTLSMQCALAGAFEDLAGDDSVRALVLTGTGADFCVGGDRAVAARMDAEHGFEDQAAAYHRRTIGALLAIEIPVLGAIEGAAFGFGAELVACCDIVLMSETARLADPHVPQGRGAAPLALLAWPRQTSPLIAAELILTGREVPAAEAVMLGLANRVVPAGTARAEALALAQTIAAMPPRGVALAKRALRLRMTDVERLYPQALGK